MTIPHGALVLVTDGRKMLFLRNEGDEQQIDLRVEGHEQRNDAPDRVLSVDEAGRVFQSGTTGRSAYQETDFHQLAEDRWAHEAAERVNRRALRNDYDELVIIAAPRTLGELRRKLHKEASKRLILEIDKEMTNQPVAEIEQLIDERTAKPAPPEVLT